MNALKAVSLAALLGSAAALAQADDTTTGSSSSKDWPEFRTLDTNGDGQVSQDEARAHSKLSGKFTEMDTDGDGSLSASEYSYAKSKKGMGSESTKEKTDTY